MTYIGRLIVLNSFS